MITNLLQVFRDGWDFFKNLDHIERVIDSSNGDLEEDAKKKKGKRNGKAGESKLPDEHSGSSHLVS